MPEYKLIITVEGKDAGATNVLSGVAGGLKGIAVVAGGMLLAKGIEGIGSAITGLASEAWNSAAALQNMRINLETLAAREIAQGKEVTREVTKRLSLTEAEKKKLDGLILKRDDLALRLKEEALRHQVLIDKWGEEGLTTQRHVIAMAKLQIQYDDTAKTAGLLEGKQGKLVTVTEKMRVGAMSMGDALKLVGPKADMLLGRLRKLAIISPFEYKQVADTYRLQVAFGSTTEAAIPLTKAITDVGAGLGMTNEAYGRMSYNLAQALQMGDLTYANLRQLKMVGLDLAGILEDKLGMSLDTIRAKLKSGKLTMEQVSGAFMEYAKENFSGAAERMSKTFTGLQSTIKDVLFFVGADLLTPALEGITEILQEVFTSALKLADSGVFKRIGEDLGQWVEHLKPVGAMLGGLIEMFIPLQTEAERTGQLVEDGLVRGMAKAEAGFEAAGKKGNVLHQILKKAFGADVGGQIILFFEKLPSMISEILPRLEPIAAAFAEVGQAVGISGELMMEVFSGPVWGSLMSAFDSLTEALAKLGLDWGDVFDGLVTVAALFVGTIGLQLVTLMGLFTALVNGIAAAANEVAGSISDIFGGFAKITQGILTLFEGDLGTGIGLIFEGIMDVLMGQLRLVFGTLLALVGGFVDSFIQFFIDLYNKLVGHSIILKLVADILKTFEGFFRDLLGRVGTWVLGLVGKFTQMGKDIVAGLKKGIQDTWGNFEKWMGKTLLELIEFLKGLLKMGSPSRVFADIGMNMGQGLRLGWERSLLGGLQIPGLAGGAGGGAGWAQAGATYQQSYGGDTYHVHISDPTSAGLFMGMIDARRRERLNESMGG